ncbi:MAG: CoA-binding protein [Acidobacteria bacterium]|nr:CoA-binding protein [Acidobacteriota bacterium]
MSSPEAIGELLAQGTLALAGVSRSGRGYGNRILRDLVAKGYRVFPVHPEAGELAGYAAYRSLADLPEPVGGLVLVVPPGVGVRLIREAAALGITRVWMQPGAESKEAIACGRDLGLTVIAHHCILVLSQSRG